MSTVNDGSFTDNLQTALLNHIGNQMNSEGARLIGDNGEILGVPGKALSHAAVAALAAEMGGGDAKGAAVGALAAELAAIRQKVMSEIRGAYKNGTIQPNGKWSGTSPSGVKIEGWLDSSGNIRTAYPLY